MKNYLEKNISSNGIRSTHLLNKPRIQCTNYKDSSIQ